MNGSGDISEDGSEDGSGEISAQRSGTSPGTSPGTSSGIGSGIGSGAGSGNNSGNSTGVGLADSVVRLPGGRDQVVRARRLVSATLGRDHPLHDDCVLLTSEIATNAVVHSRSGDGGAFTLIVSCSSGLVRISVRDDGSVAPPCAGHAVPDGPSGRGLPLLDALSDRWGVVRESGRNEVWFELAQEAQRSTRTRMSHAPSRTPSPAR